jgi:hypothetical protein
MFRFNPSFDKFWWWLSADARELSHYVLLTTIALLVNRLKVLVLSPCMAMLDWLVLAQLSKSLTLVQQ